MSQSIEISAIDEVDVVVVGAGFSGLYAVHKLRNELGLRVRAFEAGRTVGGTWNWNRYPGARCDCEGYVYCYSFSKELLNDWTWSEKYPTQPELLRYLEHVAARFDLNRDIQLETWVTSATYQTDTNRWLITTDKGERISAQYFMPTVGHLTIAPVVPNIPGIHEFEGEWHHTARWPVDEVKWRGRRVGVIGTGSSGVQAASAMAEEVEQLTVFMRTPQYSVPARHENVTPEFLQEVKTRYDEIWATCRQSAGGFPWQHNGKRTFDVSAEERQETFERLWQEGGFKFALGGFKDLAYNSEAAGAASEFIKGKIAEIVRNPETRAALTPSNHLFMARRPIVDTNYYETYNRPNVRLVDLRRTPIERITRSGIQTSDGEIDLDVIVFATGFEPGGGTFFKLDIESDGVTLKEAWSKGPRSYLGLLAAGFPNMLMVTGPAATAGNAVVSIETNVDWFAACIMHMRANGYDRIEATEAAQNEWMGHSRSNEAHSVGATLISPEDAAKNHKKLFALGNYGRYRRHLLQVAEEGYEGIDFGRSADRENAAV
jgi:cation diffusion facilitator CzcD-associated flavoprotein CzcO